MRKNILYICICVSLLLTSGCAKQVTPGVNDANKRFFDAWIAINVENPEEKKTEKGVYILESTEPESGASVTTDGYTIVNYVISDLEGNISSYTDEQTARQLGEHDPTTYYGPQVLTTTPQTIRAGVYEGIKNAKVGSKKTFVVPSWLMSYKNFATEAEYLGLESEYSHSIYQMEIVDYTSDINAWQYAQIARTISQADFMDGIFQGTTADDSTSLGFYFKQIKKIETPKEFPTDTTIYINYTGRLLNGLVFDTTIENVAKDHHLYVEGKTYGPTAVKWGEKHSDITLGSSSVVGGFSKTLWQMANCAAGSKGVGVFYSVLGYGYSGSGNIPGYAPLVFEIEFVEKP